MPCDNGAAVATFKVKAKRDSAVNATGLRCLKSGSACLGWLSRLASSDRVSRDAGSMDNNVWRKKLCRRAEEKRACSDALIKQEVPGLWKGLVRVSQAFSRPRTAAVDGLGCGAAVSGKLTESTTAGVASVSESAGLFRGEITADSPGKASVDAEEARVLARWNCL